MPLLLWSGWHRHTNVLREVGSLKQPKLHWSQNSVFSSNGIEQGTWLVHGPSHHQVSLALCSFVNAHINSSAMFGHPQNKLTHSYSPIAPGWTKGFIANKMPPLAFNLSLLPSKPVLCPFSLFKTHFLELCCQTRRWPGARIQLLGSWDLNAKPLSPRQRDGIL